MSDLEETTLERIQRVLKEQMDISDPQPANLFEDYDFDDFDRIEFVMAVEEEFDIELLDDDVDGCKTVNDLVELVDRETE